MSSVLKKADKLNLSLSLDGRAEWPPALTVSIISAVANGGYRDAISQLEISCVPRNQQGCLH